MEAENGGTWSLGKGSEVEVWNRKGSVMSRGEQIQGGLETCGE